MKKINYYLTLCLAFFVTLGANAAGTFKVTGYFPSYRATTNVSAQCDYLTDIIFSFINPTLTGTLETGNPNDATWGFDLNKFIVVRDAAQAKGTNLWIALGGADPGDQRASRLSSICGNTTYRGNLVSSLVSFAITHSCYGISLDWEFPKDQTAITNHLALVNDLKTAISNSANPNIKIAVAVGGEYKNQTNHLTYISNTLYNSSKIDEWHIMAYDFPVSYASNHSTLADATGSLDGWNTKGVPYAKMLCGVPFYARNGSRTSEPAYNSFPQSNANYTNDSYNGEYYNGITTLKDKIDMVSNKAGMGILIWDLGQDWAPSNQYSLLGGMYAYLLTKCNIPKPNLGADKGVCAPNTVVLDPGVAAANGRTFAWYKDNVLQNGQTGTTLTVSAAGTYKVVITETCGSKEDEIVIVAGSPFTTAGANGCVGDNLSLTVTNPTNGKTYNWYDAAVAGSKVGTGTSYSQVFNATTTLYVEEQAAGVNTYNTTAMTDLAGQNYAWLAGAKAAQRINAKTDLTVKSMRVFAKGPNGVTFNIKVVKEVDGTTVLATYGPFSIAADGTLQSWQFKTYDFTCNIPLSTGKYFLWADITSGDMAYHQAYTYKDSVANVYTIEKAMFRNFGTGFHSNEMTEPSFVYYGPFFKWVIETGANASCGRTAATATVITCGPPVINITKPTTNQDFPFDNNPINLEATVTDEGSVSSVSFEIWDGANKLATIVPTASGSTYSATWTATTWYTSKQYTLKVIATDNNNNSSNSSVNFTVTSGNSVNEVVSVNNVTVFPNPSTDNMNVSVELAKGGQATIVVTDLAGRTIYTSVQSMNAGKNVSSVNVSSLAAGSYLLNVSVNGENINKTFTVVK